MFLRALRHVKEQPCANLGSLERHGQVYLFSLTAIYRTWFATVAFPEGWSPQHGVELPAVLEGICRREGYRQWDRSHIWKDVGLRGVEGCFNNVTFFKNFFQNIASKIDLSWLNFCGSSPGCWNSLFLQHFALRKGRTGLLGRFLPPWSYFHACFNSLQILDF